jgi:hypothetical protein
MLFWLSPRRGGACRPSHPANIGRGGCHGGVVPSRRSLQVRTYICTVTYCTLQLHGGRTALRPDGFRSLSCAKLRAAGDEHGEASAEKVGGILPQSWTLMTDGIELVP